MSFKAEVQVAGEPGFHGNALRFPTEAEAEVYLRDLASRWLLVVDGRVVESADAANYAIIEGRAESLAKP